MPLGGQSTATFCGSWTKPVKSLTTISKRTTRGTLIFTVQKSCDIPHTQEDFIEILHEIDLYEKYCDTHPEYENNRATHAVANIKRVYDERLVKHDFL